MNLSITRRIWLILGLAYLFLLLYFSLKPALPSVPFFPHIDKLFHAIAHGLLCLWLWPLLPTTKRSLVLLFSFLFGCNIEIFQQFAPGRMPDIGDIIANSAGALMSYYAMRAGAGAYIESMLQWPLESRR